MRRALVLAIFTFVSFGAAAPASAQSAPRLAWDANSEPNLGGYVVYYGTASNSYPASVDVGRNTQWPMANLQPGRRYYFRVRAYNTAGMLSSPSAELPFDFPAPGDVVHGPRSGLFWRHNNTGHVSVWEIEGNRQIRGDLLTPSRVDTRWKVVTNADLNLDGQMDLVWQHDTGLISGWLMNHNTMSDGRFFQPNDVGDPDWRVVAAGDMNRDGRTDLIWRNRRTGMLAAWLMDGMRRLQGLHLSPDTVGDTNWEIVGAADFDGDRYTDLVWRHRTEGWVSVWLMDGLRMRAGELLSPNRVSDIGWSIRTISDINGDGRPDLVWEHTNGQIATWIMNGISMSRGVLFTPDRVQDPNWLIVGAR